MFDLRKKLGELSSNLPGGFHASDGIRSLFPSHYSGSIGILNDYVFKYSSPCPANAGACSWIGADGTGHWFFGWWNSGGDGTDINYRFQSGFVFRFSNDGFAHGYVDTSRPTSGQTSCNGGVDRWIHENWTKAFAAGVGWDFQYASGFESLPDASNIWTDFGFSASKFTALQGANGGCLDGGGGKLLSFDSFYPGNVAPEGTIPLPFVPDDS